MAQVRYCRWMWSMSFPTYHLFQAWSLVQGTNRDLGEEEVRSLTAWLPRSDQASTTEYSHHNVP